MKIEKGYIKNTKPNFFMPNGEELGEGYYFVCPQSIVVDSDYEIKLKHRSNRCKYLAYALNTFICYKRSDIELIYDWEKWLSKLLSQLFEDAECRMW